MVCHLCMVFHVTLIRFYGHLAVIHAWYLEYCGNAYTVLLEAIDQVHRQPRENHYIKVIPVVRSSGTGKSKTVDMITTKWILFPLCLHKNLGSNYFWV